MRRQCGAFRIPPQRLPAVSARSPNTLWACSGVCAPRHPSMPPNPHGTLSAPIQPSAHRRECEGMQRERVRRERVCGACGGCGVWRVWRVRSVCGGCGVSAECGECGEYCRYHLCIAPLTAENAESELRRVWNAELRNAECGASVLPLPMVQTNGRSLIRGVIVTKLGNHSPKYPEKETHGAERPLRTLFWCAGMRRGCGGCADVHSQTGYCSLRTG